MVSWRRARTSDEQTSELASYSKRTEGRTAGSARTQTPEMPPWPTVFTPDWLRCSGTAHLHRRATEAASLELAVARPVAWRLRRPFVVFARFRCQDRRTSERTRAQINYGATCHKGGLVGVLTIRFNYSLARPAHCCCRFSWTGGQEEPSRRPKEGGSHQQRERAGGPRRGKRWAAGSKGTIVWDYRSTCVIVLLLLLLCSWQAATGERGRLW